MRRLIYIHQQPHWPQFTWDAAALAAPLAAVRHQQGRLLGQMEALGFDLRSEARLLTLTRDAVESAAIEGQTLNPLEVRSSAARRLGLDVAGLPKPSRDVDGLVEMLLDATRNFAAPLTQKRLFAWHAALFPTGRTGMRKIAVGKWRPASDEPMQVVSGPYGRERVHFEAPAAKRVAAEMRGFLNWFNDPVGCVPRRTNPDPPALDPVLKAALAHFWFVAIHPFEDGNGRIARAIADLSLARADGSPERFYSMSAQIEAERSDYYLELETAQRGDLDLTRWLAWFLNCLGRGLAGAEHALEAVLYKARLWRKLNERPVNDRQRLVINRLLDNFKGPLTTSKYAKLAKCSPDTALRDIQDLLARGVLLQNESAGRSTSYRLLEAKQN